MYKGYTPDWYGSDLKPVRHDVKQNYFWQIFCIFIFLLFILDSFWKRIWPQVNCHFHSFVTFAQKSKLKRDLTKRRWKIKEMKKPKVILQWNELNENISNLNKQWKSKKMLKMRLPTTSNSYLNGGSKRIS